MPNDTPIPRRIDSTRFSPAEWAITDARRVVERIGTDPKLTEAIVLLRRAQASVAEFIDARVPTDAAAPAAPAALAAERRGDWGCTYTGRRYWPEDPRPGDFDIRDIAHALSLQCRFGGHCKEFYSVAQHAVYVSQHCDPADALAGLLHDASEAYLVDLPRPAKRAAGMEGYVRLEDGFMRALATQFGFPWPLPASVKRADEAVLAWEANTFMWMGGSAGVPHWHLPEPPAPIRGVTGWTTWQAQSAFLERFYAITACAGKPRGDRDEVAGG